MLRRSRNLWAHPTALGFALTLSTFTLTGCPEDPDDPKSWVSKLDNPREQKEALRQLARLKEKAEPAYEALAAKYKKTPDTEVLRTIAKLRTNKAVDLFAEQLDYSEETYDNAIVAANGLQDIAERDDKGREAAKGAVAALKKAAGKKLSVRSRANVARIESIKALAAIKDPSSVDTLNEILETSADDQDFFINKTTAKVLAEFADPKSIKSLTRGLWMTGRGNDMFQECRLGLVRIGEPAVDKLVETLQRKNADVEADAKKYKFVPGIIVQKAAILLGDLRSKKAVPALLAELQKKDDGLGTGPDGMPGVSGHQAILQSLGQIGDPSATKAVLAVLSDGKRDPKHRAAAAEGLNMLGDMSALPILLGIAKTPFLTPAKNKDEMPELDTNKATLVAYAVTQASRLTDKDESAVLEPIYKTIPADIVDIKKYFETAMARTKVAAECKKDVACYDKYLGMPPDADAKVENSPKAERAAFSLARLGHDAVPVLKKYVGHKDTAVRSAINFALTKTATKADADVLKALAEQIDKDKTRDKTGQALAEEARIISAIITNRS
ncbi:MAG TPA: HEAT repeat domain-containing protein [Pseudomonadota bacterium]|jgi:HEAT repeat protein|nr:HEAT repeat domain-containing protein [Pseudomonadota bacterium]HNN54204.1 HEAT repeat domain-containing protein [Pseudomonadota bacterium]